MSDEQGTGKSTEQGTDNGAAAGDDRAKWTATQWESHVQKEADRRVTEAIKKQQEKFQETLKSTTTDAETKLKQLTEQAAEATSKASFLESAIKMNATSHDTAYLVAKAGGYIDSAGKVDMDKFKKEHPIFFTQSIKPNANAGNGAGTGNSIPDMNSAIRAAAAR